MKKYKLVIAYDGTSYGGWQVQPNAVSIQSLIENALHTVLRTPVNLVGSGRTDAGVHALAQVAHFTTGEQIDTRRLFAALNGILPSDIRICSIEEVPLDFHARFSAKSKTYHYHLRLAKSIDPFKRLYAWHVRTPLDLQLLRAGAQSFVGTHDFSAFANEAHKGSAAKGAVRSLKRLDVCEEEGGVRLEFEADGFLYKMVRNITGTLSEIATGKIPLSTLPAIFAGKDRKQAGKAAPPHGLFLMRVDY